MEMPGRESRVLSEETLDDIGGDLKHLHENLQVGNFRSKEIM
jgi:hypothetical protein